MDDFPNNFSQKILTISSKENVDIHVQNIITNLLMQCKIDASSICNNDNKLSIPFKIKEYGVSVKERDKRLFKVMRFVGEIKCITEVCSDKSQVKEIERCVENSTLHLKELEHEKDVFRKKLQDQKLIFNKAMAYYKTFLDLYISTEKENDVFYVTICYFTRIIDDTYSCVISKSDIENKWTLEKIKPKIKGFQFKGLQKKLNCTNNLSVLLCTVRKILMLIKTSNN